jgi:hypothetical protein
MNPDTKQAINGALILASIIPVGKLGSVVTNTVKATLEEVEVEGVIGARGLIESVGAGEEIGVLRDALRGKGNFGLGTASRGEAIKLGESWVGEGYKVASDGKTMISADGLRQFRPPSFKPNLGRVQSNFEWRLEPGGRWQGNGHLDITLGPEAQ